MSLSTSRMAYTAQYEIMDRALEDPRGVRVRYKSVDEATFQRMRFNQARSLDRDKNAAIYPKEDPKWNVSPYDLLVFRVFADEGGEFGWIYLEKNDQLPSVIESLSDGEADPILPAPEPQLALAPPSDHELEDGQ